MKAQSAILSGGCNSLPCLRSRLHVGLVLALAQLICVPVLQVLRCQHCVLLVAWASLRFVYLANSGAVCAALSATFLCKQRAPPSLQLRTRPPAHSSHTQTNAPALAVMASLPRVATPAATLLHLGYGHTTRL